MHVNRNNLILVVSACLMAVVGVYMWTMNYSDNDGWNLGSGLVVGSILLGILAYSRHNRDRFPRR